MWISYFTLKKFILPAAFFIAMLSAVLAFAYNNTYTPPLPPRPQETLRFDEVYETYNLMMQRKVSHRKTATKLKRFISEYPQSTLADDAQFLMADAWFRGNNVRKGREALELLKKRWPHGFIDPRSFSALHWALPRSCSGKNYDEEVKKTPMGIIAQEHFAASYSDPNISSLNDLDYDKAITEYQKLLSESAGTEFAITAALRIPAIYVMRNDYERATAEYENLISAYPDDKEIIGRALNILAFTCNFNDDKKFDEYASRMAALASPTDYLFEATIGDGECELERWNKRNITYALGEGFSDEQVEMIQDAFSQWSAATHKKIKFSFRPNLNGPLEAYGPDRADIYVELTDSVVKTLMHDAAIQTSSGQGVISNASIAILNNLSSDRFKKAVLHEIGHAIGLGHSLNRNDIMSIGIEGLSDRDKNTARLLYDLKMPYVLENKKRSDSDQSGEPKLYL